MPGRTGKKKQTEEPTPSTSEVNKKSIENKRKKISKPLKPPKGKYTPSFEIKNFVQGFHKFQLGNVKSQGIQRLGETIVGEHLKRFNVYQSDPINFKRRITALQFHPTNPRLLGIGCKAGTTVIRFLTEDYGISSRFYAKDGIGPGGSITTINFNPLSPNIALTSSIDGTVKALNYDSNTDSAKVLLDTHSFSTWYCSVNASSDTGLIVAGDTDGRLVILDKDYNVISKHRLHKKKLNSTDFCKSRGWLLATASLDNSVKLWDVRKLAEEKPLHILMHDCPINAAYFNLTDGSKLLTTDQHSELRVYSAPLFDLDLSIPHPHRQFQHLTPIRASWHPLCDLIVVGRYPDPTWPTFASEARSVDIFSGSTGNLISQITSPVCEGIISLNSFNCSGEVLASGMGLYVPYWRFIASDPEKVPSVIKGKQDVFPPDRRPRPTKKSKELEKTTKTKAKKL